MKILLISDTHNINSLLINTILPKYADEVQTIVHLGDFAQDLMCLQSSFPNIAMVGVGGSFEYKEKMDYILEVGDGELKRRILLLHGHTVDVKTNFDRLVNRARQEEVHACFFGHTHIPVMFEEHDIFFMNPGSLSRPPAHYEKSYGLVTISQDGKFHGEVIEL